VDVESLYNRYSFGVVDPQAIRSFCCDGYTNWPDRPLRYVLLAGAGAMDYKHAVCRSRITPPACPHRGGWPALRRQVRVHPRGTGRALGDVTGDPAPEVAIGRLPTTSTQDLAVVVQKTIAYEGALPWKQQASLAADWDNTDDLFRLLSLQRRDRPVDRAAAGRRPHGGQALPLCARSTGPRHGCASTACCRPCRRGRDCFTISATRTSNRWAEAVPRGF